MYQKCIQNSSYQGDQNSLKNGYDHLASKQIVCFQKNAWFQTINKLFSVEYT